MPWTFAYSSISRLRLVSIFAEMGKSRTGEEAVAVGFSLTFDSDPVSLICLMGPPRGAVRRRRQRVRNVVRRGAGYPSRFPQILFAPRSGHGAEGGGTPALTCSRG